MKNQRFQGAQTEYYRGTKKYVFYKNGEPYYFYSDYDYTQKNSRKFFFLGILIVALMVCGAILLILKTKSTILSLILVPIMILFAIIIGLPLMVKPKPNIEGYKNEKIYPATRVIKTKKYHN